ncbi:hypothetical protein [Shewanella algae]|uniref:hypothetical protein n=1 Tax=Shewanella algae TaxID=38313 RepID=UPI001FBABA01|nr:hypothetical protein [Shewanella algae]
MSMVSAKEFADWLYKRFEQVEHGVSMSREDINQLTGRQNFSMVFVPCPGGNNWSSNLTRRSSITLSPSICPAEIVAPICL